ncbi:MAG TPA: ethanolamine ammonia-lyase reactivating factor EutA [Chloroflexota bacterium]|nr:ethanolamine ammonia-lyase reactivating factor EutA [Chloroflexota bacterium]
MHDFDDEHDFHGEIPWIEPHSHTAGDQDIEGIEKFSLHSVGIDIGSSTSHLVFSHLTLRREGAALSAKFTVTDRRVLYRSPILLTPYLSGTTIDVDKLTEFFHQAYREANFKPEHIDTGAVVITGEALKKENAQPIVEFFAKDSGKFICASAGPNHEALLAAYGSGAVALSEAEGCNVLNVDIGGGTSKLSLIRRGVVEHTASVEIGARLVAFDEAGRVTRVEQPARLLHDHLGERIALGDQFDAARQERFADLMADVLFQVVRGRLSPLAERLMLTEPLATAPDLADVRYVVFSGGVSEYIYGHEQTAYGDVGPLLARAIHAQLAKLARPDLVRAPAEGIRATVIGAGEYTVQVSGTTSYISSTSALPAFGLKVVRPVLDDPHATEAGLRRALAKFDLERFAPGLAVAVSLDGPQSYHSLRHVAEGIAAVVQDGDGARDPLFLVLDMDVAKSLGGILKEELGLEREIVAVDGIDVGDLDYLDIGRPMGASEALPVTVKSLLFPNAQRP